MAVCFLGSLEANAWNFVDINFKIGNQVDFYFSQIE